ncbi:MAG: hypothetical protein Q7S53_05425 [bacterium]|nr:hypothetical protein [bacterium]
MKLRIFIQGDAPEMRDAKDLADRVKDSVVDNVDIETLDIEDREGKEVAEVYDITTVPSFLVTTDDGVFINSWVGKIPAEFELKGAIGV